MLDWNREVLNMATESFYEDMVIDTPEALANLKAFAEEEPHLKWMSISR